MQTFRDTGRISKLSYLGMALLTKVPDVALPFYPKGVEIEHIFVLKTAVSEIRANFQYCHIWAFEIKKKFQTFVPHTTPGVVSAGSRFWDNSRFSKLPCLGMKLEKGYKSCTFTLYLEGSNWVIFSVWATVSELRVDFQNFHIWAWNLYFETRYGPFFKIVLFMGLKLEIWKKFQKLHI